MQIEPPQEMPNLNRRLKLMVGAWEGAGSFSPGEKLHQLLVIERRGGEYVAEFYLFRFPKDAMAVQVETPLVNGNRISLAASRFPARFDGRLDRETGQVKGQWIWQEKNLGSMVMKPLSRKDANRIRFPMGKPPNHKIKLKYAKPKKPEYGLEVGSLAQVGLQWEPLGDFLRRAARNEWGRIHGVLLAKKNRLVLEHYFYGFNKSDLHEIRSVQKGLVALLIMKLVDDGPIKSIDVPVQPFFDQKRTQSWTAQGKDKITLTHLLTMTSGLDGGTFGGESRVQNQANGDWVDYMLDAPLYSQPGEMFFYHGPAMNLLVAIAEKATNTRAEALFNAHFLDPMGIDKYHFYHDPSGRLYGAGGGALRPRDLLKFGILVTSGGKYGSRQLLSSSAMATMLKPIDMTLPFREKHLAYGLLWYIRDYEWPNLRVRTYQARGAGGQVIVAIPDWETSLVLTAGNYLDLQWLGPSIEALVNSVKLANKKLP